MDDLARPMTADDAANSTAAASPQAVPPTVLATDLDGTFLGGSQSARDRLTAHFTEPGRHLIFVTGRSLASVLRLIDDGTLPIPYRIICDVGTTVARGDGALETASFAVNIAAKWRAVEAGLDDALAPFEGLRPQPDEDVGNNRAGYFYSDGTDLAGASAAVRALGADPLVSDGTFFDVLPQGVNKGSTLASACADWGIDIDTVMVAGDTMNDFAMLSAGFKAVAVGNSEQPLKEALPDGDRIYRAQGEGCEGIIEALAHFGTVVA